jgi:Type III restriction enzyme, res subunit/Helicase conserved C-terminal domain
MEWIESNRIEKKITTNNTPCMVMSFALRSYQQAAIDNILHAFHDHHSKCLIHMATGSGKTVVMTSLCRCDEFEDWVVVVAVPSVRLVRQMNRCFSEQTRLRIRSYDERGRDRGPVECDVFVTTYHSLSSIANPELWNGRRILCLFDEAHHATSDAWLGLCTTTWYDFGVFVTATPISRPGGVRMLPTEAMSDGVCGPLVFTYSIPDGVYDGVIDSFRTVVPRYRESISDVVRTCMNDYGHAKAICFCGRADTPDLVLDDVRSVVLDHDWGDISVLGVVGSGSLSQNGSDEQIDPVEFLERDGRRLVVTCTAIGEGIDTACCEMVCFANPKHSPVSIMQNVGRALRPKGKTATVVLNCPRARLYIEGWGSILYVLATMVDPIRSDEIFTDVRSFVESEPRHRRPTKTRKRPNTDVYIDFKRRLTRGSIEIEENVAPFVRESASIGEQLSVVVETSTGAIIDHIPSTLCAEHSRDIRVSRTRTGQLVITSNAKPCTRRSNNRNGTLVIDQEHHSPLLSELSLGFRCQTSDANTRLGRIHRRWTLAAYHADHPSCSWCWFVLRMRRLEARGITLDRVDAVCTVDAG